MYALTLLVAGFLLFVALTVFTVVAVPAPLSQAGEALDWLQSRFPDISWSTRTAGGSRWQRLA